MRQRERLGSRAAQQPRGAPRCRQVWRGHYERRQRQLELALVLELQRAWRARTKRKKRAAARDRRGGRRSAVRGSQTERTVARTFGGNANSYAAARALSRRGARPK